MFHHGWYLPDWPEKGWSDDLIVETISYDDDPSAHGYIYKVRDKIRWRYEWMFGAEVAWDEKDYEPSDREECRQNLQLIHMQQHGIVGDDWEVKVEQEDVRTRIITFVKRQNN